MRRTEINAHPMVKPALDTAVAAMLDSRRVCSVTSTCVYHGAGGDGAEACSSAPPVQ